MQYCLSLSGGKGKGKQAANYNLDIYFDIFSTLSNFWELSKVIKRAVYLRTKV